MAEKKRRARGEGSIRQRKDGTWEARFVAGVDPGTGKDIRKSVYAKTQKEVRKKMTEAIAALDKDDYREPSKMTVGQWLDVWAAEYLGGFIRSIEPDALLPVPLHRKRMSARGYNQALLLARALGERLNIPVYGDYIVRVKNTEPLKYENPQERQNNLKKAFIIRRNDVKLKKVIIVDDIYTTGSTMDEIAGVLRAAGVQEVYCVALACGAGI